MSDLMMVLAGPASVRLGTEVSQLLQARALTHDCQRFPDGETPVDLLRRLPRSRLIVGNTVALANIGDLPHRGDHCGPLIATAIRRDHYDESLADLRVQR